MKDALMTPPTPMTSSSSRIRKDPVLPVSPVQVVENSPAYFQSMRNKQRLALLERYSDPNAPLPNLPSTPTLLSNKRDTKLKTPFKVPFIDRLKKANE